MPFTNWYVSIYSHIARSWTSSPQVLYMLNLIKLASYYIYIYILTFLPVFGHQY